MSEKEEPSRKQYERPYLRIYGSLTEMTRGTTNVGKADNLHGKGNNPKT